MLTNIDVTSVAYKGAAPALADMMGGQITASVSNLPGLVQHVLAGRIRAIGVMDAKRAQQWPTVPTMAEAGGPALESSTWILFLAPAGTPREIVNRLSTEVAKALANTDVKARFDAIGIDPVGTTPEQAGKFLDAEIAKWAKVIQTAGVKAEQ